MDNKVVDRFKQGLVKIEPSVKNDDHRNGVDGWLDGDIPIAFRKRAIEIDDYKGKVITVRIGKEWIRGYHQFEYDKLLSGQFKAILCFFKFANHLIVIPTDSLVKYLTQHNLSDLEIRANSSGQSDLIAIHPDELQSVITLPLAMPFNLENIATTYNTKGSQLVKRLERD